MTKINSEIKSRLIKIIENKRDKIIKFVQDLVQIPSVNLPPKGEEKECQFFIADKLKKLGMKVDMFLPTDVPEIEKNPYYNPGREYKDRPNVVGVLKGNCLQNGTVPVGKSILLAGHVDVVSPGDSSRWTNNPWKAIINDGKLYGCGTADMKSGLASEIIAIESILELGINLKGDIIFASVVDEEFGGMNGSLAVSLRGYIADAGILAEPTNLTINPATAGGQQYQIIVKGKTAFEGDKKAGVSAIEKMYLVIEALQELEKKRNIKAKKNILFSKYDVAVPITVMSICGGDPKVGGIPDTCSIDVWHGAVPDETEKYVMKELQNWLNSYLREDIWLNKNKPLIKPFGKWMDPCGISLNHPLVKTVSSILKELTDEKPEYYGFLGASDLSRFILCGNIPMLIFGPGDPKLAHTPDENVSIEDIMTATKVIALTILEWCK